MCDLVTDLNSTMMESALKDALGLKTYYGVKALRKNMIIVRIRFQTSKVDMTLLDAKYTLSDKIANFGGMFGIFAELTGCTLLGLINICLLFFKFFFKISN